MSNFVCPTCGLTNNIDCGKAGYKTDREIELEKKLKIAVKALEYYACENHIYDVELGYGSDVDGYIETGHTAHKALKEIKECHI